MRARMAELFQDESCVRWWLPNDEGFTPILQSIRAFADERNATAASTQGEVIRKIRHVFSRMRLGQAEEQHPADGMTESPPVVVKRENTADEA